MYLDHISTPWGNLTGLHMHNAGKATFHPIVLRYGFLQLACLNQIFAIPGEAVQHVGALDMLRTEVVPRVLGMDLKPMICK